MVASQTLTWGDIKEFGEGQPRRSDQAMLMRLRCYARPLLNLIGARLTRLTINFSTGKNRVAGFKCLYIKSA